MDTVFVYKRPYSVDPIQEILISGQPYKLFRSNEGQAVSKLVQTGQPAFTVNIREGKCEEKACQLVLQRLELKKGEYRDETTIQIAIQNLAAQEREQKRNELLHQKRNHQFQKEQPPQRRFLKVIQIKPSSFLRKPTITLGDQECEYEYIWDDNLPTRNDYYVLRRRYGNAESTLPTIYMPSAAVDLILEDERDEPDPLDDSEDSNREDNQNYDYPEEDYSGSSEEIISARREDCHQEPYLQDYYAGEYQPDSDEEQVYRKYLKRCRRKEFKEEHGMEEESQVLDYD